MIGTATHSIPPPRNAKTLLKKEYRTGDIVDLVQKVVRSHRADTAVFASRFPATREGLQSLFNWVDRNFTYREDPSKNQWVQTPAWLNKHKIGDCKSFTVFISTVLSNMGVDHIIRYTAYRAGELRHVYPVAILDGEEIPLDVVWKKQEGGSFGREKRYRRKKDYPVEGLYQLGNTYSGTDLIGKVETELADIEQAAAAIPDTVKDGWGDVTKMTKGELDRMIFEDRYKIQSRLTTGEKSAKFRDAARAMRSGSISGIGSMAIAGDPLSKEVQQVLQSANSKTARAFPPFEIAIPVAQGTEVSGFFKNLFKKVGNAFKNLFKKFTNWMFKGAAKGMAPFFIFKFFNRSKVKSPEIKARMIQQDKSYNFIQRIGRFDDRQLKGIMLNGILEKTGKSPRQMAEEADAPQIGSLAAIAGVVVKAIGWVIKIIEKIAGIFKKNRNEGGRIDQTTMSDVRLLEEEARLQRQANANPGGITDGGNTGLLVAAGVPLLLLAKSFL